MTSNNDVVRMMRRMVSISSERVERPGMAHMDYVTITVKVYGSNDPITDAGHILEGVDPREYNLLVKPERDMP